MITAARENQKIFLNSVPAEKKKNIGCQDFRKLNDSIENLKMDVSQNIYYRIKAMISNQMFSNVSLKEMGYIMNKMLFNILNFLL